MRNKYNRQLPEQQHHQHQIRSTFLPMLCSSSSTKQVKLSRRRCSSSSSTFSDDPSSPKVGCMGQVKRNNKVVGFPTIVGFITTTTTNTNHHSTTTNSTSALKNDHRYNTNTSSISIVKYHKLKSFFSSKSLTNSPTAALGAARGGPHKAKSGGRNVDHRQMLCRSKISHEKSNHSKSPSIEMGSLVNLEELDPPLPVVKRVPKPEEVEEEAGRKNLWKRRSGGAPLKSLQVQVIHQSNPANTV